MSEPRPERALQFEQLRRALRSLASTEFEQPALFPDRAVTAEAAARDFDRCVASIRAVYESDLPPSQRHALAAIADAVATMTRDAAEFDADVWSDGVLTSSQGWMDVRQRAASALEAFGWTED
jgi:hypothetical protein